MPTDPSSHEPPSNDPTSPDPGAGDRSDSEAAGEGRSPADLPHARVAVPVPLPDPLTYEVPERLRSSALPGMRVQVPVGRRRLEGLILERTAEAPEGIDLKPLDAVLDRQPVLPAELLELVRFVAEYYLAPPGDVVKAMLPGRLPPWGSRKVWLTDRGAIAPPRDALERAVLEALTEAGRLSLAELERETGEERDGLARGVDRMLADGRLASGDSRRPTGARYQSAVELAPGELEEHLEAAGRSKPGRAVVRHLERLGRPALVSELTGAVGCGDGVVRRLVKLGVLRQFTQVERLSLARHRMEEPEERPALVLRPDQERATAALLGALETGEFRPFLLRGVTGSGKTEVYLRVADAALERGRSVILLVPEISLVPALARDLRQRFGRRLAILHSSLSSSERRQEWQRLRRGEARVVLGPRSAVFAPVADLGLIVVDEEQDPSYKQDSAPRYHGRDVALVRARAAGAVVVATSATPSLESRYNVQRGKLSGLELVRRAGGGTLPEGRLVDLREQVGGARRPGEVYFTEPLREEMERAFEAGDQVILLRNRRGYAPVLLCRACGEDHRCEDCGLPRTLHRRAGWLLCHYCGGRQPVPRTCPECGEEALEAIGAGTERVEETFAELYPGVTADVLDRDTARSPGGLTAVLERFARGESQVLIGTQMVAKGHHFPRVALAAVLSADTYLGFPDFRAVERTYNLLVQLAGRAGRGERPGRVVIQTFHPDHYAVRAALEHDDEAFAAEEMRFRRIFHYPPYTRMVQLLVRDKSKEKAEAAMAEITRALTAHPLARDLRIAGPAPAPLERLKGKWRYQLLLRGPSARTLRTLLRQALPDKPGAELVVDVDPQDLM